MISTEGQVKVADFGLARLTDPSAEQMGHTMTGTVMGTPDYMAPEQMRGMNVDHRADIYSLGVMLYEMLCKEVPKGIFDPPSHRTGCDERIDQIVIKAMNSSPDRRYQSTEELKTAVVAARTPTTLAVSGPTQHVQPRAVAKAALAAPKVVGNRSIGSPTVRKSKVPLYASLAVGVLAVIGGAIFLTKRAPKPLAAPKAEVATPTSSTEIEPGAIKLWDTPEKVKGLGGVTLEGDVLGIDRSSPRYGGATPVKDMTLRAQVRLDSKSPQFHVRRTQHPTSRAETFYRCSLYPAAKLVRLEAVKDNQGERIGSWAFDRATGADEWALLELRAVGNQLTVSLDGKVLGTIMDDTIPGPGGVALWSEGQSYFRDIVYVPLDKASPTASPGAALEPGAIRLWDTEAKVAALPKSADVRWENGAVVMTASQSLTHNVPGRDAIIRGAIRRVSGKSHANIGLRAEAWKSGVGQQSHYRLQPDFEQNKAVLHCVTPDTSLVFLKNWPLPPAKPDSEWVQLELRAVGDTLTVVVDGQTLGSVQDTKLTEPGGALIYGDKGSAFRDIVYVPLDTAGSAPGTTTVPAAASEPWRDWIAETRTQGKLAKFGFDDDGTLVRTRAPMGADWLQVLTARDGAIRATWKLTPDVPGGSKEHYIALRQNAARGAGAAKYLALVRQDGIRLRHFHIDAAGEYRERDIMRWPLPAGFDRAQEHTLALRAVGDLLSVSLNGKLLGTAHDSTVQQGGFAFYVSPDTAMRKMEYLSLDPPGAAPAADSLRAIFDGKTFTGWHGYGETGTPTGWRIQDGALIGLGQRKTLVTDELFDDFELSLEWRAGEKANGGIIYLIGDPESGGRVTECPEFALQDDSLTPTNKTGSLYNAQEATKAAAKPLGEWNTAKLVYRGGKAEHWVNDQLVCSYELKSTKFGAKAGTKGKIGLQGWLGEIAYRNVMVRPLDAASAALAPATTGTAGDSAKPTAGTPAVPAVPVVQSATAKWLAEQEPQWQAAFVKEVSEPFEKGVADLKKQYLAVIETQLAAATKAANLDDAVAFRAERERLAGGGAVPVEDEALVPASLKTLRASYRTAFAKLDIERFNKAKAVHARYDAILAQSQTALTQRQRLDEALELKAKRESLSAEWLKPPTGAASSVPAAAAEPAPAAPKPAAGAATDPPPSKTPKLKPRELIERLLAMGALIDVVIPGSAPIRVEKIFELPGDKFAVNNVKFPNPREGLTEADLDILEQLGDVADLDLAGLPANDTTIDRLRRLPKLRSLILRKPNNLTEAGFKSMAELPALQALDINIPFSTECLVALGKARQLNRLLLFGTSLTEQDFTALASIPALARLTLITNQSLPPAAWARLGSAKNLIDLNIGQVPASAAMIAEISKLAGLENLTLNTITFPDAALAPLGALKSLRTLRTGKDSTLDGSVFANWPLRPNMKSLSLISRRSVSDEALLAIVTAFPKLERLDVTASAESVTAAGFAHLTKLKQLSFLDVTGDGLDDAALLHLVKCDQLYYLSLGNARVTESGVQSLPKLGALRNLDWINPPVTESALKSYGKLRALTDFRIGPETTPEIEQKLKAALPKVKILR